MAEHSEPTPNIEPDNSQRIIPLPAIPHRRWLLDGRQLSLCYEKARPVSRAKHSHPEIKIWIFLDSASGVFTSWNVAGELREIRLTGRQAFCVGPQVSHAQRVASASVSEAKKSSRSAVAATKSQVARRRVGELTRAGRADRARVGPGFSAEDNSTAARPTDTLSPPRGGWQSPADTRRG